MSSVGFPEVEFEARICVTMIFLKVPEELKKIAGVRACGMGEWRKPGRGHDQVRQFCLGPTEGFWKQLGPHWEQPPSRNRAAGICICATLSPWLRV